MNNDGATETPETSGFIGQVVGRTIQMQTLIDTDPGFVLVCTTASRTRYTIVLGEILSPDEYITIDSGEYALRPVTAVRRTPANGSEETLEDAAFVGYCVQTGALLVLTASREVLFRSATVTDMFVDR